MAKNPFFSLLLLLNLLVYLSLLPLSSYAQRCGVDCDPNDRGEHGSSYGRSTGGYQPLLLSSDVKALNNITSMFQMKMQRTYGVNSCQRPDPYDGISCKCNFNETDGNITKKVCRVTELIFTNQDFSGIISPLVGNLTYLKTLDLSGNKLHGSIPTTLENLLNLEKLDLSYNQLVGSIPNIVGTMRSLSYINLNFNFLEGSIPPSLGDLPHLNYLYLSSNLLTGSLPWQMGNITSLLYMYLGDNQLTGTLPPELGNLRNLITMQISGNNFTEEVPHSFGKLNNLEIFAVRGNGLSGRVPHFIANWKKLRYLHLMGNNFEGPLPTGIFELANLFELWVTDLRVSLDYSFPPLSKLTALHSLILRNCEIFGEIPEYVGNMALTDLDLSFNRLSGDIPAGLQKLDFLCLTRNDFKGSIPDWVPNSVSMDFSYNNFSNSSFLQFNESSYVNTFTPTALPMTSSKQTMNGSCPHEKYSSLHINCGGHSTIINGSSYAEDNGTLPFYVSPDNTWAYSSSGDFLSSSFGPQNNTKNMTCGISVSDAPLYATARISPLTLDYYGLCLRNGVYNVTLHFAEIVFSEKDDHSILGKRLFDIFIQGERVVKDFNIKSEAHGPNERVSKFFQANVTNNLLNIHLYWAGKGSIYVAPQLYGPLISAISITSAYKPGKKLPRAAIAAITASSIVLPLLLLAILWKLGCLGRKNVHNDELEGAELKQRKLTYQNIVEATQNFSPREEIGSGSSGTVYKAILRDQSALAVKKISARSIIGLGEFLNEVRTLESMKNENLVQLLGWYTGADQLLLIYEYMENNSLYNALFELRLEFSWETRYRICLQIAKGLVYLHEISQQKIIHRDIKTSNILLDENLNAKISDFGLARFYNEEQGTLMTKLCGTHGYMAPEYALRGLLSEKTDVYSYGVVILEIVTGKSNAAYKSTQESEFLLDEAYVLQNDGNLLDLIDGSIVSKPGYSAKQASKILTLAMMCTNQSPSLRPTMSQVLSVLQGTKTIEQISTAKTPNLTHDSKHCISCCCDKPSTSFDGN